jgi:hypothetical protein
METNDNKSTEDYVCKICNKEYKNKSGIWKHNKKYHNDNTEKIKKSIEIQKNLENKYKCNNCNKSFHKIEELDNHIKTVCPPDINHNNVFTFKTDTFGKNKYPNFNGGDIYIIQTEFNLKHYYKIGVTVNLYNRMKDYRCGAVLEPRIHCYFPIKNIKEADKLLKTKLQKYNIKREIYKCENLDEIKQIIKSIQKEHNSEVLEIIPEIKKCDVCQCHYCEDIFTSNYELQIHLKSCEDTQKLDGYKCKYCPKIFKHIQSRWKHENRCKIKNDELIIYKEKNELLKKENDMFKKEFETMKSQLDLLLKSSKKHPMVFKENQTESLGKST